jgi:hypothetical protein
MSVAKLKITKDGKSDVMVIGMGADHRWWIYGSPNWFPARSGTWARGANATKFHQFTMLILFNAAGDGIANLQEPPYRLGANFHGGLRSHWLGFSAETSEFEVEPIEAPPPTKHFRIRERWDANVSYFVFAVETAGFEIQDDAGASALYLYKGAGLSSPLRFRNCRAWGPASRRLGLGMSSRPLAGCRWAISKATRSSRARTMLALRASCSVGAARSAERSSTLAAIPTDG